MILPKCQSLNLKNKQYVQECKDLNRGITDFKEGTSLEILEEKTRKRILCRPPYYYGEVEQLFPQLFNVQVRQAEIHTAVSLVTEPRAFEVELAIGNLKSHTLPGTVQIPAELIKAGGRTIRSAIHKIIISIWYKAELSEEWKESIIVPIFKKRDKTDCNNYRGMSLLQTTYEILSNILLSRLTPYAEEVIGDHQCGFRRNRSTTDHIICIRQTLEKKWEYNEAVHQLFIDFKKAYDSVRREDLYNILIEFGIPKKLLRLKKMCLAETYNRARVGKILSDMFPH